MLQLLEDRGLSCCLKPKHQDPQDGLANPTTRVPEHDALVANADDHPSRRAQHLQCRSLLVDAHQFTETTIDVGVQRCEHSCIKLTLLAVPVTRISSTGS